MTYDEFIKESEIVNRINIIRSDLRTFSENTYPFWSILKNLDILKCNTWSGFDLNPELESEVTNFKNVTINLLENEISELQDTLQFDINKFESGKLLVTQIQELKEHWNRADGCIQLGEIEKCRQYINSDTAQILFNKYKEYIKEPIKKIIENKIIELETELEKL